LLSTNSHLSRGTPIPYPLTLRYILFYKPYGVLSQFTDDGGRQTLKDYIPVPDVYPVGRLDWDSEGLVLLTDDGRLQHRLSDPQYGHPRTYWVQVERIPDERAIEQLATGVEIQNYQTKPARAKLLELEPQLPPRDPPIRDRQNIPTAWLELTLTEGKNRQVRRMTAAVGFPTLRLVRVSIGLLSLEGLSLGSWRDLTSAEVKGLKKGQQLSR
jgi:23S rRNA pseudouridine2457 synthase